MLYFIIIALIFYRFFFIQLDPQAFEPPYWINAGAVAISTLAGAFILENGQGVEVIESIRSFVLGLIILFWSTATWWIPLLIILGNWRNVIKRVKLSYDRSYWGMVFPLGMYTACTIYLAKTAQVDFLLKIIGHLHLYRFSSLDLNVCRLLRSLVRTFAYVPFSLKESFLMKAG